MMNLMHKLLYSSHCFLTSKVGRYVSDETSEVRFTVPGAISRSDLPLTSNTCSRLLPHSLTTISPPGKHATPSGSFSSPCFSPYLLIHKTSCAGRRGTEIGLTAGPPLAARSPARAAGRPSPGIGVATGGFFSGGLCWRAGGRRSGSTRWIWTWPRSGSVIDGSKTT